MQRSLTKEAKTRMEMGGVERRQHTGARQPNILSLVLPLKSLGSLERGFFVGRGLFLISVAIMAFMETKISWVEKKNHSCSFLSEEFTHLLFYSVLVQLPRQEEHRLHLWQVESKVVWPAAYTYPVSPLYYGPWPFPLTVCLSSRLASLILLAWNICHTWDRLNSFYIYYHI